MWVIAMKVGLYNRSAQKLHVIVVIQILKDCSGGYRHFELRIVDSVPGLLFELGHDVSYHKGGSVISDTVVKPPIPEVHPQIRDVDG
jgi:hypothetical protein